MASAKGQDEARQWRRPRFTNWARTCRTRPLAVHEPAREDELVVLLERAARESTTVRAVGAGHSWTAVAGTEGHMVRLDRMAQVLEVDTSTNQVTVAAGIRLRDLSARLAEAGLGLSNLGSISERNFLEHFSALVM